MSALETHRQSIYELCNKHKVGRLFAFGSVLTDRFGEGSDVDMVVRFKEMNPYDYADNYFDLKTALENLFNRKVDLLENQAIRNPYLRKSIDATKQLIYG